MSRPKIVRGQHVDEGKAQRAVELRYEPTPEEAILWQMLRANQLGGLHFRRQQVIDAFIVDFYYHAAGLVVEVDGEIHQQQLDYDIERDAVIASHGLRILRITNKQIHSDLPEVLELILLMCQEKFTP